MRKYLFLVLMLTVIMTGCKSVWKGTVAGATTGLVIGASSGKLLGNTAVGALGGAAIGGSIGAISSTIRKNATHEGKKVNPADSTKVIQPKVQ